MLQKQTASPAPQRSRKAPHWLGFSKRPRTTGLKEAMAVFTQWKMDTLSIDNAFQCTAFNALGQVFVAGLCQTLTARHGLTGLVEPKSRGAASQLQLKSSCTGCASNSCSDSREACQSCWSRLYKRPQLLHARRIAPLRRRNRAAANLGPVIFCGRDVIHISFKRDSIEIMSPDSLAKNVFNNLSV